MKKFLSLFLCLVLALGMAACGSTEESTDTGTEDGLFTEGMTETETQTETQTASTDKTSNKTTDKTSDKKTDSTTNTDTANPVDPTVVPEGVLFDASMEHKVFATDIKTTSLIIFDLNRCIGDLKTLTTKDAVCWVWDPETDNACRLKPGRGLDAVKLRYSPVFERDVVIACSSDGWAGIIDYEARKLLWEYHIGDGPHSIEMLPNGDLVVAGSGNGSTTGKIAYVPFAAGIRIPTFTITAPSAHGVMWDPQNEVLWGLEMKRIVPYRVVNGGTKDAKLEPIEEDIVVMNDNGGHVLSPILGQPGKYWVSAGKLWIFDSMEKTLKNQFTYYAAYNKPAIKGMASFPDGTFVQTVGGYGNKTLYDWSCSKLRVGVMKTLNGQDSRPVVSEIQFTMREFYKVFPVTKDYQ